MSKVYIVAGPPGIGKSTSGKHFVPPFIEIMNHDKLLLYYKYKQEVDYEDLANLKANKFVLEQLRRKNDFGIELNLGFDNHYELLKFIKREHLHYQIEVILFYTDHIDICLNRAISREKFGGHHVDSEIILKMYENTLPLIKKNVDLINEIQLIDVDFESIDLIYSTEKDLTFSITELPDWVKSLAPETLNLERF
jgi:predicted ABC-type ATPase